MFWEGKAAFWKEVGVDAAVCEAIGVASPDELDKFPEKAVLGNVDCPAYGKCLAQIFESQRRGNRGDVDAAKNKMRGLLKEDGIKEVLRARFEDLADSRWDYIIDNMYKLVHFDHIFSSACTGRGLSWGLHSTVSRLVSTESDTPRGATDRPPPSQATTPPTSSSTSGR